MQIYLFQQLATTCWKISAKCPSHAFIMICTVGNKLSPCTPLQHVEKPKLDEPIQRLTLLHSLLLPGLFFRPTCSPPGGPPSPHQLTAGTKPPVAVKNLNQPPFNNSQCSSSLLSTSCQVQLYCNSAT